MTDQNHPARNPQGSSEGGDKDTNNLHDIKDVQKQDMLEKGQQIDQTPERVKDTDQGQHPQQLPRN